MPKPKGETSVAWIALLNSLIAILFCILMGVYVASNSQSKADPELIQAIEHIHQDLKK